MEKTYTHEQKKQMSKSHRRSCSNSEVDFQRLKLPITIQEELQIKKDFEEMVKQNNIPNSIQTEQFLEKMKQDSSNQEKFVIVEKLTDNTDTLFQTQFGQKIRHKSQDATLKQKNYDSINNNDLGVIPELAQDVFCSIDFKKQKNKLNQNKHCHNKENLENNLQSNSQTQKTEDLINDDYINDYLQNNIMQTSQFQNSSTLTSKAKKSNRYDAKIDGNQTNSYNQFVKKSNINLISKNLTVGNEKKPIHKNELQKEEKKQHSRTNSQNGKQDSQRAPAPPNNIQKIKKQSSFFNNDIVKELLSATSKHKKNFSQILQNMKTLESKSILTSKVFKSPVNDKPPLDDKQVIHLKTEIETLKKVTTHLQEQTYTMEQKLINMEIEKNQTYKIIEEQSIRIAELERAQDKNLHQIKKFKDQLKKRFKPAQGDYERFKHQNSSTHIMSDLSSTESIGHQEKINKKYQNNLSSFQNKDKKYNYQEILQQVNLNIC